MGNSFSFEWEVRFMEWLQSFDNAFFSALGKFFTLFGEELFLVALIGLFYWCLDKKTGKYIATNFLPTIVAGPLIKNILLRRRPYMDHSSIKCLKSVDSSGDIMDINVQGYSFPSMHASNTLSGYGSVAVKYKNRLLRSILLFLIIMIGISRVYVGVHYPTDILAGWGLGIIMLIVISLLQKKIKNHLIFLGIFGVLALPGWFYCTSNDFYTAYGLMVGTFAAFYIEDRFVKFENTKNIIRCILRVLCGVGIFFVLNEVLKLPFSKETLEASTFAAHLIRAARYAIVSFVIMGVYPLSFKLVSRKFKK